jgi:hypothetical protein
MIGQAVSPLDKGSRCTMSLTRRDASKQLTAQVFHYSKRLARALHISLQKL